MGALPGALPVLHVVTDDEVLAGPRFHETARALLEAHGPALALHVRGPGTAGRGVHDAAAALVGVARRVGAVLLVNDRADVALAVGADGVQLGRRSLPADAARRLGPAWLVGVSIHGAEDLAGAHSADFAVLGTIWETASHPDRAGGGTALLRAAAAETALPLIAIGGVTPERAGEAVAAGAHGVAVLRGVWHSQDPVSAAASYLSAMGEENAG